MDIKQISLTGEEVPMQADGPPKPKGRGKYRTMQQLHGMTKGKICGDCEHFIVHRYSKTYFKCELWHQSSSAATDIRKKSEACGLWEEREDEDGSSKDE